MFALPALAAAVVTEWSEAGSGAIARLRDRAEALPHGWGEVPGLIARGSAVVVVSLIGVGAAVAAVAVFARAGQIVALFQAGDVDALGATVLTLAQLAYVPTLAVWGLSFVAGPGFAVGEGTSVSPAGTQVGVVPGLPALGAVPDSTTSWLLLLALLPIAIGAFAGWIARSRLLHPSGTSRGRSPGSRRPRRVRRRHPPASTRRGRRLSAGCSPPRRRPTARSTAEASAPFDREPAPEDPIGARVVVTGGIALVAGGAAALLAFAASGSLGPGRLSTFGPEPGPVALAVGLEVLLGAAILLLAPRSVRGERAADDVAPVPAASEEPSIADGPAAEEDPALSALAAAWTGRRAADEASDRPTADAGRGAAPTPIPGVAAADARTEPIDLPVPPPGERDGSE